MSCVWLVMSANYVHIFKNLFKVVIRHDSIRCFSMLMQVFNEKGLRLKSTDKKANSTFDVCVLSSMASKWNPIFIIQTSQPKLRHHV